MRTRTLIVLVPLFVSLQLAFTGCGNSGSSGSDGSHGQITAQISASPSTIEAGQLATITWATTGATSVTVSPNLHDEDDGTDLPLSGSVAVTPAQTTTYTLTATGAGGAIATKSVTVTVTAPKPTISISASPETIFPGQQTTLTWTSKNATSVQIDGGVGSVELSGSVKVGPQSTTTYTATAQGSGGTQTATVTVSVPAQTELAVTLSVDPPSIAKGGSATLKWASQNATSVQISDIGPVALSGSTKVSPQATKTYTATAQDAQGKQVTASATLTVLGAAAGLSNIKHIIFFVQENRTFDNYFSKLNEYRAARGLSTDVETLDPNVVLKDSGGHSVPPFHQRTVKTENLSPAWAESHFYVNYNSGSFGMDHFMAQQTPSIPSTIDPHYTRTMGYYTQDDIPFYYALATEFATSDAFHASVLSGTIVNRTYIFSATSAGMIRPSSTFPAELPTIFRSLSNAGITWRYYYQDGSVFLAQYTCGGSCDWDRYQKNVWNITNYFDVLASPTADRDLPQVIFIQHSSGEKGPATALDEHPGHNVQKGAAQVEKIVRALMNSAAWPSSVMFISHDEGGGLYDHVPPYPVSNPDGISPKFLSWDHERWDDFNWSGFRVPFLVVSPWVKPHLVSHTNREFTSILKFIETRFNLPALTKRDAEADDLTEFFDFTAPRLLTPPSLPTQPTNGVSDINLEEYPDHP